MAGQHHRIVGLPTRLHKPSSPSVTSGRAVHALESTVPFAFYPGQAAHATSGSGFRRRACPPATPRAQVGTTDPRFPRQRDRDCQAIDPTSPRTRTEGVHVRHDLHWKNRHPAALAPATGERRPGACLSAAARGDHLHCHAFAPMTARRCPGRACLHAPARDEHRQRNSFAPTTAGRCPRRGCLHGSARDEHPQRHSFASATTPRSPGIVCRPASFAGSTSSAAPVPQKPHGTEQTASAPDPAFRKEPRRCRTFAPIPAGHRADTGSAFTWQPRGELRLCRTFAPTAVLRRPDRVCFHSAARSKHLQRRAFQSTTSRRTSGRVRFMPPHAASPGSAARSNRRPQGAHLTAYTSRRRAREAPAAPSVGTDDRRTQTRRRFLPRRHTQRPPAAPLVRTQRPQGANLTTSPSTPPHAATSGSAARSHRRPEAADLTASAATSPSAATSGSPGRSQRRSKATHLTASASTSPPAGSTGSAE